jgi:hypothetical protein
MTTTKALGVQSNLPLWMFCLPVWHGENQDASSFEIIEKAREERGREEITNKFGGVASPPPSPSLPLSLEEVQQGEEQGCV